MRYTLLILSLLMYQFVYGQTSSTKVVRVVNNTTVFTQALPEGSVVIDLNTDKCYLLLKAIAGTNSLSNLVLNTDYKEISVAEYQTLDVAQLNGTKLELSLSGDGEATHQIELSSLSGGGSDSTFVTITTDTLFVADEIGYVDSAHGVKINKNLTIEADGTLRMDNEATVWEDLLVFPSSTNRRETDAPTWEVFRDDGAGSIGTWLWWFSATKREEVFFTVQVPHSYKLGTNLQPHVHWTVKSSTVPTTSNVEWCLEYTITSIGEIFGQTTTIKGNTMIPSITNPQQYQHFITPLPDINGTNINISAVISCRLYRDGDSGNTTDTYNQKVALLGIDFHFEKDTQGSRLEFIK